MFRDLTINLRDCSSLSRVERIERILSNFGSRLKIFKLWCSIQGDSAALTEVHLVKMLSWMPELEDLSIKNVFVEDTVPLSDVSKGLDLFKLKTLLLDHCMMTPAVLELIPADVLTNLVFTFESYDETAFQNFFNRQKNIKTLEIFENDQLRFDHLQLEHIKISSNLNFTSMIRQQPKLKYINFTISEIDDSVFNEVCKLKHLEVLRTCFDEISCQQFKEIRNLQKLRELRLDSFIRIDRGLMHELSMMKLTNLEKLTLVCPMRKICDEAIIQMSMNFAKVKNMQIMNLSIQIITTVLANFLKLEKLLMDFCSFIGAPEDILDIADDFRHEGLQELVLTNSNQNEDVNSRPVLKLVNACPNLKVLMLSDLTGFTVENFRTILETHPNLTHLSLEFEGPEFDFDDDIMEFVKISGENLVHLRLRGLHFVPTDAELLASLGNKFPITCKDPEDSELHRYELTLKKRGEPEWYLNYNYRLMDHF